MKLNTGTTFALGASADRLLSPKADVMKVYWVERFT